MPAKSGGKAAVIIGARGQYSVARLNSRQGYGGEAGAQAGQTRGRGDDDDDFPGSDHLQLVLDGLDERAGWHVAPVGAGGDVLKGDEL